jgi:Zn-dependent M28 family amino/carboxypeptidase
MELLRRIVRFAPLATALALAACAAPDPWPPTCGLVPATRTLVDRMDADRWLGWIRGMSGAEPVTVGGMVTTIETRDTRAMAAGLPNARAFEWLLEQVRARFPEDAIEVQTFRENWRNLTVTRRGRTRPNEVVLVTAHVDSLVIDADKEDPSPGADDDATGAATLLELASILPDADLKRTVRLVWTMGEEQGLVGCEAWADAHDLSDIRAVLDLDMLGWDGLGRRTMQVHMDDTPGSTLLGTCVATANLAYGLGLAVEPRVGALAMGNSCHSAFWHRGIPAAMISEDVTTVEALNPFAHTIGDTVDTLALPFAFDVARAAAVTALSLAEAVDGEAVPDR